ncbi:alcohol dehydrogenase catalytic domain-containing protein [Dongshaea marina]|uniref:alcohol dehydrogenase catalytic domain-containing protein n=1 Tax=Dongshaea marina TaxID=2047966 RepID=UPI0018FF96FB|nr:alcohol dehydrogenase catalytic domain-containing protein [Dongshaea marina]
MQALTFDPNRDRFTLKKQPLPTPGPTEVQLKVVACGLNPVDSKIREWKSLAPDMDDNWVPGLDVSGVITELGEEVEQWKVGDRILYHGDMLKPHGGFSEYAVHNAQTLLPHPNIDPIKAAATPCAGWTAWRALMDKLKIDACDSLLIAGGSGG